MKLSQDEVRHLAGLARLKLDEDQADKMTDEVGSIIEYVESIQKIDVTNIEPFSMSAKSQGFRPDQAFDCDDLTRELILENFPGRAGDLLAAPGVFTNPKS